MVHQTMSTKTKPAPNASKKIIHMRFLSLGLMMNAIVGLLSCSLPIRVASPPVQTLPMPTSSPAAAPTPSIASQAPVGISRSKWVAANWTDLPQWSNDSLPQAWGVLLRNCERPIAAWISLCPDVRRLSIADETQQRQFLMDQFQPYRIENLDGESVGLLTAYYEPVMEASRIQRPGFDVPLYKAPTAALEAKRRGASWFTRQEIDTLPQAQLALKGTEIAWLSDPVDALILHIQGSGRLRINEKDESVRTIRVAFAASNEQPYQSVGRWLLDKNETKDASWPGIKAWIARNPNRVQEMLWSNPRFIFFKEEEIPDSAQGPKGAQGVSLTAGRSIAVDPLSIPYSSLVWLSSDGPTQKLNRLVVAQDTGNAITGAVRADFYMGTGQQAGELAGRTRQQLRMWALWPR